jgi:murein L,D-transpeptidase YcbB/YkuD
MFRGLLLACLLLAAPLARAQAPDANPAPIPAWTGPDRNDAFESLIAALEEAERHGLRRTDYSYDALSEIDPDVVSDTADALASRVFRDYAEDLLTGRINPLSVEPNWPYPPRNWNIDAALDEAMRSGEVAAMLDSLAPQTDAYRALQRELLRWLKADDNDWPAIETSRDHMERGESGTDVRALRARLVQLGWLRPFTPVSELPDNLFTFEGLTAAPDFDAPLEAALQAAQRSARLSPDGVAGPETLAWLNRTPSDRIDTLRANLERHRWLPDDLGDVHIVANVPDFTLQVVVNGRTVRRHDVIVGRVSRPTPTLTAYMAYMIINPWWETPHSLAVRDELPLFRRDPGAVSRLGFQVLDRDGNVVDASTIDWATVSASSFPYRLRQAPGPLNALGVVKFIFPNPHSTFLHDTPGRQRFDEIPRALSSGCVRVRDAQELADWIERFTVVEEDRPPIAELIASGHERRIEFAADIRVHFLYFTAFPEGTSSVRMVRDLYHKDHRIIEALGVRDETAEIPARRPDVDHSHASQPGVGYGGGCPG